MVYCRGKGVGGVSCIGNVGKEGECPIRAMAGKTFVNLPPLWVSCLQGNISWVVESLARGANPNTSSPGGVPGLMYASSRGHNDILEVFLRLPF